MSSSSASAVGGGGGAPAPSTSTIVAEDVTGSHVLRVEGYSKTKGLGVGESVKSGTFSVGGHNWYIRYYPDGEIKEDADWVSIFLCHDHHPGAKDVKARFKFSLLDHIGKPVPLYTTSSQIVCTFSTNEQLWGYKRFMERKTLEESTYLRDDCFSVRCDVTVRKEIRTEATRRLVVVPPSDMHRHLGRLLSAGEGADVTFEVSGETFAAHRCVLAARSSVFMAELFGPMKEKTANCVQIDDMEARVFKLMLHFIYTDSMPDIDEGDTVVMLQHLLVAADRYNLERLKLMCEDRLCNCIDTSMAATTLALAEQHGCHRIKEACLEFLKSPGNFRAVMASDGFEHLARSCPSLLKELAANLAV